MIRWMGAFLVVAAGSICGFSMAGNYGTLERTLQQMLIGLEVMHCQIEFRMTSIPELCQILSTTCVGAVGKVFSDLELAMQQEDACEVSLCMMDALSQNRELPEPCARSFRRIGRLLGQADLQTQLKSIELETERLRSFLQQVAAERPGRVKSYRALGVSCGIALAILLL